MYIYKIGFLNNRVPQLEPYKDTITVKKWRNGYMLNEIIITATGRNSRFKNPEKNVLYTIYDYSFHERDDLYPLRIEIICNRGNGTTLNVIVSREKAWEKHMIRNDVDQFMDAIILVDATYSTSARILYEDPFHKSQRLCQKLKNDLVALKDAAY